MRGRHATQKKPSDPTYSAQWSGVTYAPECPHAKPYNTPCGHGDYHHEGGSHYCPGCDDFKPRPKGCTYA